MDILDRIDEIVGLLLPEEISYYDKSKFINDPVLGTIEVKPYEQSIIDTPLYQRLRYIHQTGFTYYTYPTARHSRFEHSLGVMTIATKIFDVLKDKNDLKDEEDVSLTRIRLAGLLHDIGHSAFSHTTEEYYSHLSDIRQYIDSSEDYSGKGAGEVLSSLIISSKSFVKFFESLKTHYKLSEHIKILDVAKLITGKPISKDLYYEADIVSGPIDADKLDYFPRDGRAAGLEISMDMHRLINCMEIQDVNKDEGDVRKSLVINFRGYNALQQLLFARATLTASVYHHHKVRACDSMLKNVLQSYCDEGRPFNISEQYPHGLKLSEAPNYILVNDNSFVFEQYLLEKDTIQQQLLKNLFSRNVFKRILNISMRTMSKEAYEREDEEMFQLNIEADLSNFYNIKSKPKQKELLVEEIIRLSGVENISKYHVAIDIPHKPNFEKAGDAAINTAGSSQKPRIVTLKEVIPINDWIKGYEAYFAHAYIFGPPNKEQRIKLAYYSAKVLKSNSSNVSLSIQLTYDAIAEDIRKEVRKFEEKMGETVFNEK